MSLGVHQYMSDIIRDSRNLPNSETSKRWVVSESLNTHWLGWNKLDDSGVTRLDELRSILNGFTRATINLLKKLGELACNVGGVAIKHGCVSSADLTRVVENDDLSVEGISALRGVILGVTSNIPTTDLLYRDVLNVEANVVAWHTLGKLLVVHLNRLDFSGDT